MIYAVCLANMLIEGETSTSQQFGVEIVTIAKAATQWAKYPRCRRCVISIVSLVGSLGCLGLDTEAIHLRLQLLNLLLEYPLATATSLRLHSDASIVSSLRVLQGLFIARQRHGDAVFVAREVRRLDSTPRPDLARIQPKQ